ncbi:MULTISPECIES: DUF5130 family protein [Frankia]|uniref:DUF5130 domain-containing protein n=1 Tax=Frankia alni (strain DSM 45986 / CECT 9034 / ACN14a) TaxID=326424 RepID=Q0RPM6_FRAAA|nr:MULTISPECIES: DUF5130 family protein [Frankia]CAJ60505.1 hypothetical protein FRAAL1854 [Frankia alni ACN14a]
MATGEAFTSEQLERLNRALELAQKHSGVRFGVRLGSVRGDVRLAAERILSTLVEDPARDPAVLILVSPGQCFVRVATTPAARKRISDSASGLAALTMTSSFSLGDLVGGLTTGIRQLGEAAGPAAPAHAAPISSPAAGSPAAH